MQEKNIDYWNDFTLVCVTSCSTQVVDCTARAEETETQIKMEEAARSSRLGVPLPSLALLPEVQACAPPHEGTSVFCFRGHVLLREIKKPRCVAWIDGHSSVPCFLLDQLAFDVFHEELEVG